MNPFTHMLSDSAPWDQVVALLEHSAGELPPDSWRPTIGLVEQTNLEDPAYIQSALWEILQDHLQEATKALMHRYATGTWPELSPQAIYQLRLIHSRCLMHLAGIAVPGQTIFGFPKGSPKEVALWMTTMWWTDCGFPLFLGEIARRNSPPPCSFEEI